MLKSCSVISQLPAAEPSSTPGIELGGVELHYVELDVCALASWF